MSIHIDANIARTWTGMRGRTLIAACAALVAVVVIGTIGAAQANGRASDRVTVESPATPSMATLRSLAFDPLRDYRIYVVGSQEQADSLRSVLSEMEEHAQYGPRQLGWTYEVVVLESSAAELGFARMIADLNDDRVIRGLPEIWVVDYRDL